MKKDITYINSLGESVCFGTNLPEKETVWHFRDTNIFDFKDDYTTTGGKITKFYKPVVEKEIEIFTHRGSLEERDRIIDVVSYDKAVNARGKLYAGTTYMRCTIFGISDIDQWYYSDGSFKCKVSIVADSPHWIREHEITLFATQKQSGGFNYPHDFPHNYGYDSGSSSVIENPFKLPCKVNITFPGPCVEPYVIIAGNRYQVTETAEKGSLILVQAYGYDRPRITLRSSDGSEKNIFWKGIREPNAKIFAKVPVGKSVVSWRGVNNIGITLCEERDSPCWTD